MKLAINGLGRIGRSVVRAITDHQDIQLVAVNDLSNTKTLAHLLKYDSIAGKFHRNVTATNNSIKIQDTPTRVFSEKNPAAIDWSSTGAEIVIESSGKFTNREAAGKHLGGTVKKVVVSALSPNADATIVLGVNENSYDPRKHFIISNASCTTNCLAPVAKIIHENFIVRSVLMTTVHSYTNDQSLLDLPHKDPRRARAAALSMIPTSTGGGRGVEKVIPELHGKIHAMAIRVPVANVSLIDAVINVERQTTIEEVNRIFKEAASGDLKGVLAFSEEPLVSVDFRGNSHSSIVDGEYTKVVDGRTIKILAWYDNESGYSCRLRDLLSLIAKRGFL